jgi:HK97 family phage portal protein
MNLKAAWNALIGKRAAPLYGGSVAVQNGQVVWVSDNFEKYFIDGYSANDLVYSITKITSEKIKVAPWGAYQVVDESSLKRYKAEVKKAGTPDYNHKKCLDLRTKALEAYDGDSRLNELLMYPNESETFSDLVAHSSIDKMITGNRYIRSSKLEAGVNEGKPFELGRLPPQFMNIVVSRTFPMRVIGYQLTCGTIIPLEKEEILHDKDYNPLYDINGSHLVGMSPLKAARYTLTNENSSLEASTKSFQNMGPGGIVYVDDERLSGDQTVEQAGAVKSKWYEEYSGPSNTRKMVVSGYKMGYQEMGLSPVDLQIIEQQKWNLVRFCNVWNFPHPLLLPDHLTDNNYQASEKALIGRCAMPLMTSFRDNFNRKLQSDWGYKGKNIYIDFDLSVYSELQQDMGKLTDWVMKSWHLTPRMRYELQQLEVPENYQNDPMLDKIFVPSGFEVIENLDPANMDREMDEVEEEDEEVI